MLRERIFRLLPLFALVGLSHQQQDASIEEMQGGQQPVWGNWQGAVFCNPSAGVYRPNTTQEVSHRMTTGWVRGKDVGR